MNEQPVIVAVLAHNEEARIASCLRSLPVGQPGYAVHVVVNGSRDRTAEIARSFADATVHEYAEPGKSRSWNRFVFDTPGIAGRHYVFVDGDAEVAPGSIEALLDALEDNQVNAASGLPLNGRHAEDYRKYIRADHGLFGDLYALKGAFVEKMRRNGVRLPNDLIGDDGLIGALAKTDLQTESEWNEDRVRPVEQAGFFCEPVRFSSKILLMQAKRMRNYSTRHFQNRIISTIMRDKGAKGLPKTLASLYPHHLGGFQPRRSPVFWWFDRQALRQMQRIAQSTVGIEPKGSTP